MVPALPEIVQVKTPVGAIALPDPTTVATIEAVPPKIEAPVAVSEIDGEAGATIVEFKVVAVATGLYDESPGKVNVAK